MNFDLADLRAFVAVAELGSFHAAADTLHLSPPALSRRIQKLEDVLGVRLFDRTTRIVRLTVTGREFSRKARTLLDDLETALLGIQDAAGTRTVEVTIACVASVLRSFVLNVLKTYRVRSPNIRVRTVDAGATDVLSAVIQGEAEFGLNFIGMQEPEIEFEPIAAEPYVLICRSDDVLGQRAQIAWSELAGRDFIGGWKGSGNRLVLDLALANLRPRPRWCYEVKRLATIPALVEAGLGIAAIPRSLAPEPDHSTLVCVPLVEPVVMRNLGMIRRRGRTLSPPARQLYDLIAEAREQALSLAA